MTPPAHARSRTGAGGRRGGLVLAIALTLALHGLLLVTAAPAAAHETDPSIAVELRSISPTPPEGLTIQVVTSIEAQLVAENRTNEELTVLGRGGVPFLRIGPEGVLANLNAPDWYRSNDPTGAAPVPPRAQDPGAEPEWARASSEPTWGWFDHRLHEQPLRAADLDVDEGPVAGWEIPMRYGDADLIVAGEVVRRPIFGAVTAVLDSDAAIAEGLTLALLPGPLPGLFLSSDRSDTVIVRGPAGEPFLRVRPDGVDVNTASPVWAENAAARGQVPDAVDPTAAPRWTQVASVPRFGWLEPRARPGEDPPREVTRGDRVVTLERWEVPLEVGGEVVLARGTTRWQPFAAGGAAPAGGADGGLSGNRVLLVGVVLAAAGLLAVGTRWRRRRT